MFLAGAACPSTSKATAQDALQHGADVGLGATARHSTRWLLTSCSAACKPLPSVTDTLHHPAHVPACAWELPACMEQELPSS